LRRTPLSTSRFPEPGSSNLGEFLADNASGLAQVLGVSASQLDAARALDDEELAPHIRQLLERARDRHVQEDLERRRQRSLEAAHRLGATARWTPDRGAELDVDLLLGELLADKTKRRIDFAQAGGHTVSIARLLISAAAPLRRIHVDLASVVDEKGLHFRWRGGRGGYNWYPREVDAGCPDQVLTVPLVPPVVVRAPERRPGGAWLGHILKEMGYLV
jgi:hypothetical protein